MQHSGDQVNALSSNNEGPPDTMQTASANPQEQSPQQSPRSNVDEMATTASQQSQHAEPSIDAAASMGEVTDNEEEDPLRDLETAADKFADSGSVTASDAAVAVNDESNEKVSSTLAVEDRLLDIFYRADVAQKADTFGTLRDCIKAVIYRWRVTVGADVTSQMAFTNGIKYALTMSHDGDSVRVPSHNDIVRIAVSDILTHAMSTGDWVDNQSGTKIFDATFSAMHIALQQLEKDMGSMQKTAKVRKTAQRMPASSPRKRKAEDESPEDNTAVASAHGELDSSPVKKAKRVKKHEETEWSTAEDVELRDMRTKQNCQWWFSHTPDQRAAYFKTWLDSNHYNHTRSKNALEQRSDMWRKDAQKDPNPDGPPILTKAQCKGAGAQNTAGTIVVGATGAAGPSTTRSNVTRGHGTTSANITVEEAQDDEESADVDVDDIINRYLQPLISQAGMEAGSAGQKEHSEDEAQEQQEEAAEAKEVEEEGEEEVQEAESEDEEL
ncbi:hypothetical protein KC352_g1878 [Hortaea werneckii]|nr:hypothetical protein KC358_g700 [Hortaea werneckii]KAI6929521.1 hypothetical protein KC348_g7835 [Hortaea werneckii]KAI6936474.1 hypothetical protein KC341_g6206 [Hortaea werneckii]KAI6971764.1 hypothetical protein KC321_g6597 [Hortaea werneckii]KAI7036931.1 hypothetical protein KC362_g7057 [Hortaea werneckii]